MQQILVLGAGKIGTLIAYLLANSNDYVVYLADAVITNRPDLEQLTSKSASLHLVQLDAQDHTALRQFMRTTPVDAVVSSLPYYLNSGVATFAKECQLHYFDLTEDVRTADTVHELAKDAIKAFVPRCGLAPGLISVIANDLMRHFPELDTVKMRVGALPLNISNALQYSLTWSTDGLINEYGNFCEAIEDGKLVTLLPLDDVEEIKIDGLTYEAFNTSGGIGSLAQSYLGRVKHLSYKTIRYPGHCAKMRFLMNDLELNHDRDTLKRILENVLPKTSQDVVLVYVSVTGMVNNQYVEKNYVKKFYPKVMQDMSWSAIQLTTASELCAVLDIILSQPERYKGLVTQEQFTLDNIIKNRFGQYYG